MLSIICDIYVISFSEGSIYRRGARRWRKLYRVNGHIFQAKRFNRVSIIPCNYHCTIFTLFITPISPPPRPPLSCTIFAKVDLSKVRRGRRNRRSVQSSLVEHFQHSKTCWLVTSSTTKGTEGSIALFSLSFSPSVSLEMQSCCPYKTGLTCELLLRT